MAEIPHDEEPDVRFTLANERTLLAYQRTAIGLMAGAIAVVHFFGDDVLVVLLAFAMLITGVFAGVGGYVQFRRTDAAIRGGRTVGKGFAAHILSLGMLICLALAGAYVISRGL